MLLDLSLRLNSIIMRPLGEGGAVEAPAFTSASEITGNPYVGSTLTCVPGARTGNPTPTLTYQWRAEGVNIPIATSNTWLVDVDYLGDMIDCVVTATNTGGNDTDTADEVGPVELALAAPVFTGASSISGTPTVGETLTCTAGTRTGNPTPTLSYQWRADAVNIGGATSATYELTSGEIDAMIDCVVTATNSEGSDTDTADDVGPVAASGAVVMGLVIVGQSNEEGAQTADYATQDASSGDLTGYEGQINQLIITGTGTGTITDGGEPLRSPNRDLGNDYVGPGMPLAKQLIDDGVADEIIIILGAKGGQGFSTDYTPNIVFDGTTYSYTDNSDKSWEPDGVLTRVLDAAIAKVIDLRPDISKWLFVGHCGENDQSVDHVDELNNYVNFFEDRRTVHSLAAADSPVIMLEQSPGWTSTKVRANGTNSARHRVSQYLSYAACATSPAGPYDSEGGNFIHFRAEGQALRGIAGAGLYDLAVSRGAPRALPPDILDGMSPSLALSVWRRLLSAYTGDLVRCYRVSDTVEADFGTDADGLLDIDAIQVWAGSSVVRVKPYDQSGNARHPTHATPASWPILIMTQTGDYGPVLRDKMWWVDNDTKYLLHQGWAPDSTGSFVASIYTNGTDGRRVFSSTTVNLSKVSGGYLFAGSSSTAVVPTTASTTTLLTTNNTAASEAAWVNSIAATLTTSTAQNATTASNYAIGGRIAGSPIGTTVQALNTGYWAEFMAFDTPLTTEQRDLIHTSLPGMLRDQVIVDLGITEPDDGGEEFASLGDMIIGSTFTVA